MSSATGMLSMLWPFLLLEGDQIYLESLNYTLSGQHKTDLRMFSNWANLDSFFEPLGNAEWLSLQARYHRERSKYFFVIRSKLHKVPGQQSDIVGLIALFYLNDILEIGSAFVAPPLWGKGIYKDAIKTLTAFAFSNHAPAVTMHCNVKNERSAVGIQTSGFFEIEDNISLNSNCTIRAFMKTKPKKVLAC